MSREPGKFQSEIISSQVPFSNSQIKISRDLVLLLNFFSLLLVSLLSTAAIVVVFLWRLLSEGFDNNRWRRRAKSVFIPLHRAQFTDVEAVMHQPTPSEMFKSNHSEQSISHDALFWNPTPISFSASIDSHRPSSTYHIFLSVKVFPFFFFFLLNPFQLVNLSSYIFCCQSNPFVYTKTLTECG